MIKLEGSKITFDDEGKKPSDAVFELNVQLHELGLYPRYRVRLKNGALQIGRRTKYDIYTWLALYGKKVLPFIAGPNFEDQHGNTSKPGQSRFLTRMFRKDVKQHGSNEPQRDRSGSVPRRKLAAFDRPR